MKLNEPYLVNYNFTDEKKGDPNWQERFGYIAILEAGNKLLDGLDAFDMDLKAYDKRVYKQLGIHDDDIVFYIGFDHNPTRAEFKREMKAEGFIIHSIHEED